MVISCAGSRMVATAAPRPAVSVSSLITLRSDVTLLEEIAPSDMALADVPRLAISMVCGASAGRSLTAAVAVSAATAGLVATDAVSTATVCTVSSTALLSGCVTVAVTVALTVAVAVSATVSAAGDTLCMVLTTANGLSAAAGAVSIDGASPVLPSSGCIPAVVVELLSNASVVAFFSIMPGRELSSSTAASSLSTVASSVFGPLNQYQLP